MPRYPKRAWFNPLGSMAAAPHTYALQVYSLGFIIFYPFRYRIAEWYERQSMSPDSQMRGKAISYYQNLDRTHKRQAMVNNPLLVNDFMGNTHANQSADALKAGVLDFEYAYWHAHQRDAMRAEKLVGEVRELQAKIAKSAA
jgi:hypothetical protein